MNQPISNNYTVFDGHSRIGSGVLGDVALIAKRAIERNTAGPVLIYSDATGRPIDIDPTGSDENTLARLPYSAAIAAAVHSPVPADEPRGRGRPKLGVVAREVTLLPRHWDWLATQPGGASVALRKLVEEARRNSGDKDRRRGAQEAAYRFMNAMAGDLPGFEEATRALFADDQRRFAELVAAWPPDVRDYAVALAFADPGAGETGVGK